VRPPLGAATAAASNALGLACPFLAWHIAAPGDGKCHPDLEGEFEVIGG
jgi:hypothetical protein